MCRISKAEQGLAVFEAISEEQHSGRVVDRMIPPRGYNATSTSGLVAFEVEGDKLQLPFGPADLQVLKHRIVLHRIHALKQCFAV